MASTSSPWPFPIPSSSNDLSEYDFKPFLSAPAVAKRAKKFGGVIRPLHIPGSPIPSPLARDISPDQLLGLKARLVGSAPETSSLTENGREIWLSWKRAWDLWNNHYIHGRVNPGWIKGAFKEFQEQERRKYVVGGDSGELVDVEMTDRENNESTISTHKFDEHASSGGFQAIKCIPQFKEPPFDPEVGDDGIVWDDPINNSVWRPRRVGEKTVQVDLDIDPYEFLRNSDLEIDRGVDCGRLPYPVLRPLIEYIQLESGAFIKKKTWDGVTGTVFNMPTKPLEPTQESEDVNLERVGEMFGDSYRAFKPISANDDIFPLDIRRIRRVYPPTTSPKVILPLLQNQGDSLLRDRQSRKDVQKPFIYRDMLDDDPWYVTDEQKTLMDCPPRRYPPPEQKYKSNIIPVDDTIFSEEFDSDQLNCTRYFVTNLHGGTLIINGVEIQKGDVAGPLPKFAIIECPGGQIAFWFGSHGRNHLAGQEESSHAKWLALRQRAGWKYTGLSAGQVWNAKIKDRIERKKAGENEHDDEQWEAWLSVETPDKRSVGTPPSVIYNLPFPGLRHDEHVPLPDNIAQPHVTFPTEQHELAWLTAQCEHQETREDTMDIDVVPSEEMFFPGSKSRSDYIAHKGLTQQIVDDIWTAHGAYRRKLQRVLVDGIREKKDRKVRAEEERLKIYELPTKRKNEVVFKSLSKKLKTAAEAAQEREEELERELLLEFERGVQQGLNQESHHQLQREWNEYTTRAREEHRKRKEEESAKLEETRKKDKDTLSAKDHPSADAEVNWTVPRKTEDAINSRQLQIDKDKLRERKEVEFRENPYNSTNYIQREQGAQTELRKRAAGTQSKYQITERVEYKNIKPAASTPAKQRPFVYYIPQAGDATPEFDVTSIDSSSALHPTYGAEEDQQLLEAMASSKKSYRDNVKQAFMQSAIAEHKTIPEYLKEHGCSTVEEYLDYYTSMSPQALSGPPVKSTAPNGSSTPAERDLKSFRDTLRQAYADGSKARARLENKTWEQFIKWGFSLSPNDYLDMMVEEAIAKANDMSDRVTEGLDMDEEALQRWKWATMCDMVTEASDFDSQTRVASLPPEKYTSVDGKPYAVV